MRERIEKACAFIEKAVVAHERDLGREVGDHLLTRVYDDDLGFIFRNDPTREPSLRDIARATPVTLKTLSRWLKAAAVRRRLDALHLTTLDQDSSPLSFFLSRYVATIRFTSGTFVDTTFQRMSSSIPK
jgi:hypothetical protein